MRCRRRRRWPLPEVNLFGPGRAVPSDAEEAGVEDVAADGGTDAGVGEGDGVGRRRHFTCPDRAGNVWRVGEFAVPIAHASVGAGVFPINVDRRAVTRSGPPPVQRTALSEGFVAPRWRPTASATQKNYTPRTIPERTTTST